MSAAALAPFSPASRPEPPVERRFVPGVSGNRTGRPKGERGLAKYIRARTRSGREMVDVMLGIMRGEDDAPIHERISAISWLANRGFGPAGDQADGTTTVTIFTLRIGEHDGD